jgi:hypothetical protein
LKPKSALPTRVVRRSSKSKEEKKISPEERLLQRWEQQVFFLKKMFPQSEGEILSIRKRHERKAGKEKVFEPSEDAILALMELYADLKSAQAPAPGLALTVTSAPLSL